jgi:hypothetical protein
LLSNKKVKKRRLSDSPHVVTYIDILGFRELVQEKSPAVISRAIRHVKDITVPEADKLRFDKENYVNFSDLIVHTIPVLSKSNQSRPRGIVSHEIRYMAMVQAVLIEKGLLLRGAISVGKIERSYGVLFGPGLISAYELERDQAKYPRIILDEQLMAALRSDHLLRHRHRDYGEEMKFVSSAIKRDDDDVIFIDYLGFMQTVLKNQKSSYHGLVETHKNLIEMNIAKFQENKRVLSKYLWLRKYHNAVVHAKIEQEFRKEFFVREPGDDSDVLPLTGRFSLGSKKN